MTRPPSYYELLGVSRAATPSEIRSAYLRLMKRHHPDAGARDGDAPDFARLLNRCYGVLRDPLKRSEYDAQLLRSEPAPAVRPLHQARRQTRRQRSWRVVALATALIFSIVWLVVKPEPEQATREFFATAAGWMSSPAVATGAAAPLPGSNDVLAIAELARRVSSRDAEQLSRDCFAATARQARRGAADTCVLFDTTFLYWRKTPAPISNLPPYFADHVVFNRHSEAMAPFGSRAEQRLVKLREMGFRALIDSVQESRPVPGLGLVTADSRAQFVDGRGGEGERSPAADVPERDSLAEREEQKVVDFRWAGE